MLNSRQKAFSEYFAACGNAAEAARRAGYSERTARQQGDRLLTKDDVRNYISEITKQLAAQRIADATEIKQYLTDTMRSTTEKTSDRIKAGVQLLRAAGTMTAARPEEAEPDAPPETDDHTVIALPFNGGDPATINAFQRADGEVIPFAGSESKDVLIYVPLTGWREEDYSANQ